MAEKKSILRWRHAGTGRFLSDTQAERKPADKVVHERVPISQKPKK